MSESLDLKNAQQHARTVQLLDHYALALEEIATAHNALAIYVQQLELRVSELEGK
ncbi:hypothetical protein [Gordonia polyisoprenivorans]|uniref:hypothetical protein n=1 Tax=Gordonia polyisoprenivorans TaxID=84595 RepID=UPI001AD6D2D0|nr:hypothetical protein [Gordonia polyisoprenivorans]QTI67650.1 hypothetical protein J6U32_19020 [Gordonia polyisoprenivorans]